MRWQVSVGYIDIYFKPKQDVLARFSEATPIIHTIMPDRHKVNGTNSPVMYPHPIAFCMGKEGKVLALDVN